MRKEIILFAILFFLVAVAIGQQTIKHARQKGHFSYAYRITADSAEKFLKKYNLNPDQFLNQTPVASFKHDSIELEKLPIGNYIIVSVVEDELVASFHCQSLLRLFAINNQKQVQLEIKDKHGKMIQDANLRINGRNVNYNQATQSFHLPGKKMDEAIVRIESPGDTLFMEMTAMEDLEYNGWGQWWRNFASTKVGRIVSWPVRSVKTMFTRPIRGWIRKRRKPNTNNGYIVFNKPKYQPGDTLRFKAYVLNKKYKRYKAPLDLYFDFYSKGKNEHKKIAVLKPELPGNYVFEMPLADSFDLDQSYTVGLFDKKNKRRIYGSFRMEDYLLKEVATNNLRAATEIVYKNDTIVLYASAKDANGLSVMDGRANYYILTKSINKFYENKLFVPDTLWKGEIALQVNGETEIKIPTDSFPNADILVKAQMIFKNSNNETQEKEVTVDFVSVNKYLKVEHNDGIVVAELIENGKSVPAKAWMYEGDEDEVEVSLPFSKKINPYAEDYEFEIRDVNGKEIMGKSTHIGNSYQVSFDRFQSGDTSGFVLTNPYKIPVHYTVMNGNKPIAEGADSAAYIIWKKVLPRNRAYGVTWNYVWNGYEMKKEESIAVLDKVLKSSITGSKVIYPGQTDTITVSLTDYKNRPAENVNIAVASYNSQFGSAASVKEPPYLQRFKSRRRILMDKYEIDDAYLSKRFVLGEHQGWRKQMKLDTMPFYQLLFPKDSITKAVQPITDFAPQLAVHVVKKGVPQEIYMLYINREFAYYNGVTDKSVYSFSVYPGYTQIDIRLKNRFIEIDSIYLQPYYKYDIVFDMDKLPQHSTVSERKESYTYEERNLIESQVMQLQNDYRTNYGYIWQNSKLIYLGSQQRHLIGPFRKADSLQYFKPGDFDLKFSFESGYEYKLSPKMARLERRNIFYTAYNKPVLLPTVSKTKWVLGDTIIPPPAIVYNKPIERPYFKINDYGYGGSTGPNTGALKIEKIPDSVFIYAVLFEDAYDSSYRIRNYNLFDYLGLKPGKYHLVLVTKNYQYFEIRNIEIKPGGVMCINLTPVYTSYNDLVESLPARYDEEEQRRRQKSKVVTEKKETTALPALPAPTGRGIITGRIIDAKGGNPIVSATVRLKGYNTATITHADGSFSLNGIKDGEYIVMAAYVGYEWQERRVKVSEGYSSEVNFYLHISEMNLQEVVVTAYGVTRARKELSYSFSTLKSRDLTGALMGVIPGVQIDSYGFTGNADTVRFQIRGNRSIDGRSQPLIILNGLPVDASIMNELDPNSIGSITTLKGDQAFTLYGSVGMNGAIIITTKDFVGNALRENFRDYAFWIPTIFTDKDGKAKFTVTYPDNITSWQTYVVGMDKKRRFVKGSFLTKSFKPLMAQLATPQFLIEGDSSQFIGKAVNYSENAVSVKSEFRIGGQTVSSGNKNLNANAANTEGLPVFANSTDTVKAQYSITSASGFSDGELRKIPVFRKGIEEAKGNFWTLENDTSISFTPDPNAGKIELYAQNNTLDILLDEIKYLKEYPYFCMEQTASKLTGLLMENEIRKKLNQPFKGDKDIEKLLKKLQESQQFSGGWAWWPNGETNITVTNYVLQALLPMKNHVLAETNIRNGLLYLQNNIVHMERGNLLASLYTMSEAGHYMDYASLLIKLPFDSLSIHQQWQVLKIKQKQKLEYENELQKMMKKKIETMLGGLHWGDDSYYWESNAMATTALAFRFFENEEKYQSLLRQIIRYFLERREGGRWRNTVESAKTLAAILPTVLKQNKDFTAPAVLNISGAEPVSINKFPFTQTISNTGKEFTVTKTGGGLIYFTAWQKIHNPMPQPVSDKFEINTWFERNGQRIEQLKAGEKTIMKIKVNVLKDADYVQIEIPIPAGCTYAEKKQQLYRAHAEFYKNKQVLFVESLKKGTYTFEIELEPRYSGSYHLNPAKAELMYFPIFYGRNEMKKTGIKN